MLRIFESIFSARDFIDDSVWLIRKSMDAKEWNLAIISGICKNLGFRFLSSDFPGVVTFVVDLYDILEKNRCFPTFGIFVQVIFE